MVPCGGKGAEISPSRREEQTKGKCFKTHHIELRKRRQWQERVKIGHTTAGGHREEARVAQGCGREDDGNVQQDVLQFIKEKGNAGLGAN